jgi:hypothetical protein
MQLLVLRSTGGSRRLAVGALLRLACLRTKNCWSPRMASRMSFG